MTSTDLIVPGDDSPYAVLAMPQAELTDLIQSNLSPGESVSIRDLPRVKIPAGGATTWEVPDALAEGGSRAERELRGVIIRRGTRRAFWREAYTGEGNPPDCSSNDGLTGKPGETENPGPGGACAQCPLNEFPDGGGSKPCKEIRQLFILPHGALLPMVLNVTPGSLQNAKAYFFALMNAGLKPHYVETVLTLTKAQSNTGIAYAQVTFRKGANLDPQARATIAAYTEMIAPDLERAAEQPIEDDHTNLADAA